MRRALLATFFAVVALMLPTRSDAAASHRSADHFGIGVGGGTTSGGLSIKYFLSDTSAIQGVIGSYGGWSGLGIGVSADYLYEMPLLYEGMDFDIGWNVGVGAGAGAYTQLSTALVAANGVAGLEFAFVPIPLDLVIEYRPTLYLLPLVGFDFLVLTGHLRWFF